MITIFTVLIVTIFADVSYATDTISSSTVKSISKCDDVIALTRENQELYAAVDSLARLLISAHNEKLVTVRENLLTHYDATVKELWQGLKDSGHTQSSLDDFRRFVASRSTQIQGEDSEANIAQDRIRTQQRKAMQDLWFYREIDTKVTSSKLQANPPAITPEGKFIFFTGGDGKASYLKVDFENPFPSAVAIRTPHLCDMEPPAFTPNGQGAVLIDRSGMLSYLKLEGKEPEPSSIPIKFEKNPIYIDPTEISICPDNQSALLVGSWRQASLVKLNSTDPEQSTVASIDTKKAHNKHASISNPAITPDGQHGILVDNRGGVSTVQINTPKQKPKAVPIRKRRVHRRSLLNGISIHKPAITPDGKYAILTDSNGRASYVRLDFSQKKLKAVKINTKEAHPIPWLTIDGVSIFIPVITPDGQHLILTDSKHRASYVKLDFTKKELKAVPIDTKAAHGDSWFGPPVITPDGQHAIFSGDDSKASFIKLDFTKPELAAIPIDLSSVHTGTHHLSEPIFTPDGKFAIFQDNGHEGRTSLVKLDFTQPDKMVVIPIDTSLIHDEFLPLTPVITPDSKFIIFTDPRGKASVWNINTLVNGSNLDEVEAP